MRTLVPKPEQIRRNWYLVDADGLTLGRIATKIASVLRGKNKPYFTPHIDAGDFVIVINADKVRVTGNKEMQKTYQRYSGYPGGLTEIPYKRMMAQKPEEIIKHAVKGMLPKNILGRALFKKLHVYSGPNHPHKAQKPETLALS